MNPEGRLFVIIMGIVSSAWLNPVHGADRGCLIAEGNKRGGIQVNSDSGHFGSIVAGISRIVSPGAPGPVWAMSADWRSLAAGDEDTTFPSTFVAARIYGKGRVAVMGHEGLIGACGVLDNGRFMENLIAWLNAQGGRAVLYTTGHSEWVTDKTLRGLRSRLNEIGYTLHSVDAPLMSERLAQASVLIVGNAWDNFADKEIEAVRRHVNDGGGVLLVGLGWSWKSSHLGSSIEDYPMMRMAAPYKVRWLQSGISDPTDQRDGAPVFHTFYPHIPWGSVTEAIAKIDGTHAAHRSDLSAELESNSSVRLAFVRAHQLLAVPAAELPAADPQRRQVFDYYRSLATRWPASYSRQQPFDEKVYPTMTWLRERFWRTWELCLKLTAPIKSRIATAGRLTGFARDIFLGHGVILLDNCRLDPAQLGILRKMIGLIPSALHNLGAISVKDFLGTPAIPIPLDGQAPGASPNDRGSGFVNIIGWPISDASENSFPADVPPGLISIFVSVAAHEINHVVNAFYITPSQRFRARHDRLIADAGSNHLNYLRSMIPDGYFLKNPQEFFASIANQWFTDSAKTIRLGLARFDAGRRNPINQALFFADVYSKGGQTTFFFNGDTTGELVRKTVPLRRDAKGRIIAINVDDVWYSFILDTGGNVIDWRGNPSQGISPQS